MCCNLDDVLCSVCGEAFDAHYLDMLPWERALFNSGAGCPCCEGISPHDDQDKIDQVYIDALASRLMNGIEEEQQDLVLVDHDAPRPPWERPEDRLIWQCDECGFRVFESADDSEHYPDASHVDVCADARYTIERDTELEPEHTESGICHCSQCWLYCDHCGEGVLDSESLVLPEDCYHYKHYCCEDCLSAGESEQAEEAWDSYGRSDFQRSLAQRVSGYPCCESVIDDLDDSAIDELIELARQRVSEEYIVDSSGVCLRVDDMSNEITDSELVAIIKASRPRRPHMAI